MFACNSSIEENSDHSQKINPIRETIDGPANIRDKPNGKLMFTMSDGLEVDCGILANNWFEVGVFIPITEEQDQKGIDSGFVFTDSITNQSITFHQKTELWMSSGDSSHRIGFIAGYTHQKNIQPTSIPENELQKLLENKEQLSLEDLSQHIQTFGYESTDCPMKNYEKLQYYMIYGSWMEDPSPIDRLRLVFEENILIAVIHERPLKVQGKKSYPIFRNLNLLILKEFEKEALKKFIAANVQSYRGVD